MSSLDTNRNSSTLSGPSAAVCDPIASQLERRVGGLPSSSRGLELLCNDNRGGGADPIGNAHSDRDSGATMAATPPNDSRELRTKNFAHGSAATRASISRCTYLIDIRMLR